MEKLFNFILVFAVAGAAAYLLKSDEKIIRNLGVVLIVLLIIGAVFFGIG